MIEVQVSPIDIPLRVGGDTCAAPATPARTSMENDPVLADNWRIYSPRLVEPAALTGCLFSIEREEKP